MKDKKNVTKNLETSPKSLNGLEEYIINPFLNYTQDVVE